MQPAVFEASNDDWFKKAMKAWIIMWWSFCGFEWAEQEASAQTYGYSSTGAYMTTETVSRMLHLARNLPKCFDIREIVTIVLLGGVFFRCSTLSVLFKYEITANRLIQWIKGINGRIQLRHTSDHSEFIPLFGRGRANTSFVKNAKACWVCKSLIGL